MRHISLITQQHLQLQGQSIVFLTLAGYRGTVTWRTLWGFDQGIFPDNNEMLTNIGLISYAAALVAYTLLAVLVLLTMWRRPLARPLLAACSLTAAWAGVIAGSTLLPYPQVELIQLMEVVRNAAWCFLLLKLIGMRLQGTDHILASSRWIPWFAAGFAAVLAVLFTIPSLMQALSGAEDPSYDASFAVWLAMAILGLLLLEQVFRNSRESERWSIKHLCLGLGLIFAYDFFMYAEALLFRHLDPTLWQARGIVVALAAVLVAVSMHRIERPESTKSLYVSRHVAFHSVTLLAAGTYLLLMALVGYFIRYLGGSWGGVLQITFLCASGLLLLALLFSGKIRAKIRVWLSKHFFSYKYDYRTEWLQFTQILARGDKEIPENIIRAIAQLTKSTSGLLWALTDTGRYALAANWEMAEPSNINDLQGLPEWLQKTEWIIDLQEWRRAPDIYEKLDLSTSLLDIPRAWLIIPLMFGDSLQGILLLRESNLQTEINWEDRDLLKMAGRQAASHLAQYQANQALVESQQFAAFNRLSAYVIHDLKNILAQQSLIVSNAEKHRQNPAFFDDVLDTVRNSVERMTRLMEQMRSGVRGSNQQQITLISLVKQAVENRSKAQPTPVFEPSELDIKVEVDGEHLATVFTHIIQNAQEATTKSGNVVVRIRRERDLSVVEIEDDGTGMDEHFLRNRLFKPFESTKGLTGMGIGAFESREFVRNLGGDIQVTSTPGAGSLFRIVIPCIKENQVPKNPSSN